MIVVRQPGPLTTVQDLGRPGRRHLGVPLAGAVDRPALRAANRLVGNAPGAAALETTLAGPELAFEVDAVVAVAGGRCTVTMGGEIVEVGVAVTVRRGRTLVLGLVVTGVRSYLAVRGGLEVPAVLGSRSSCTLSGLGPSPLAAGDRLRVGEQVEAAVADGPAVLPEIAAEPVLRLVPGPREDAFAPEALPRLTGAPYVVTPSSDRSGVRLAGAALPHRTTGELLSEGVVPGAVQVPPDGQPIVFLANCPTTGGYPVIGVVVPEDLPHVAQARAGSAVRFAVTAFRR
ncbi:MAG: biotin-dependent carboxyltransferase family protein [Mycobacteriales bacterium]